MGCCKSRRIDDIDTDDNNAENHPINVQIRVNNDSSQQLLSQNKINNSQNNINSDTNDDDTQQLLRNNDTDYLSTGQSQPPQIMINNPSFAQHPNNEEAKNNEIDPLISPNINYGQCCQTPPILKTLFGGSPNLSDHDLDDDETNDSNKQSIQ